MSETDKNLAAALSGESQAHAKYTFIAELAAKQGKPRLSALFKAAAQAEEIHARRLFTIIRGTNLEALIQEGIDGEKDEYIDMYPSFKETAEKEGRKAEAATFAQFATVEQSHSVACTNALAELKKGIDLGEVGLKVFLCPICGNIEIAKSPSECPVCKCPVVKIIEVQ